MSMQLLDQRKEKSYGQRMFYSVENEAQIMKRSGNILSGGSIEVCACVPAVDDDRGVLCWKPSREIGKGIVGHVFSCRCHKSDGDIGLVRTLLILFNNLRV